MLKTAPVRPSPRHWGRFLFTSLADYTDAEMSRRVFQATVASPKARAQGVHARLHAQAPGQHLKRGREVERVFAVRAWDRPVGLGTVHPSSTAAVVAVVGLPKTLRLLAERWFAFSLDLIEALADEGKVIGYSCQSGEPRRSAPGVLGRPARGSAFRKPACGTGEPWSTAAGVVIEIEILPAAGIPHLETFLVLVDGGPGDYAGLPVLFLHMGAHPIIGPADHVVSARRGARCHRFRAPPRSAAQPRGPVSNASRLHAARAFLVSNLLLLGNRLSAGPLCRDQDLGQVAHLPGAAHPVGSGQAIARWTMPRLRRSGALPLRVHTSGDNVVPLPRQRFCLRPARYLRARARMPRSRCQARLRCRHQSGSARSSSIFSRDGASTMTSSMLSLL